MDGNNGGYFDGMANMMVKYGDDMVLNDGADDEPWLLDDCLMVG